MRIEGLDIVVRIGGHQALIAVTDHDSERARQLDLGRVVLSWDDLLAICLSRDAGALLRVIGARETVETALCAQPEADGKEAMRKAMAEVERVTGKCRSQHMAKR